ncbi:MAG: hypothetical protein R3F39_22665 [Myxococcota bacterium]
MKFALALALFSLVAPNAAALTADDEAATGELRVSLNTEYCKVQLDGEDWSGVEFENGGKTLVILNLDLARESVEVTLTPAAANLEPETLTVASKDFKRLRRGRIYYMVASRKVNFAKRKAEPAPAPEPERKPEPEPKPERRGDEL